MIPTQRAEIARALSDLFVLKGKLPLGMDEVIVPIAMAADLTETPYMRYAVPCCRSNNTLGLAGSFGYQLLRPGIEKVLQCHALVITNSDVAAHRFDLRIGTAAFVAQLDAPGTVVQLVDAAHPIARTLVSSFCQTFTDVAGTDTGSSNILTAFVPATSSLYFPLP